MLRRWPHMCPIGLPTAAPTRLRSRRAQVAAFYVNRARNLELGRFDLAKDDILAALKLNLSEGAPAHALQPLAGGQATARVRVRGAAGPSITRPDWAYARMRTTWDPAPFRVSYAAPPRAAAAHA